MKYRKQKDVKAARDEWNREHVMNAVLVKRFSAFIKQLRINQVASLATNSSPLFCL